MASSSISRSGRHRIASRPLDAGHPLLVRSAAGAPKGYPLWISKCCGRVAFLYGPGDDRVRAIVLHFRTNDFEFIALNDHQLFLYGKRSRTNMNVEHALVRLEHRVETLSAKSGMIDFLYPFDGPFERRFRGWVISWNVAALSATSA
jgi:hypothetical protein